MRSISALALSILFGVLFYLGYYGWWAAIFFAVAPLAVLAGRRFGVWEFFCLVTATTLTWLLVYSYFSVYSKTGLFLLSLYHGVIVALVVCSASWWRRWSKLPMCFAFPIVWVGGEFWRMSGAIGMPLGLLALPAHEQLWMIQVGDLGGTYALSFAMAMVGGLLADLIQKRSSNEDLPRGGVKVAVLATLAVWVFIAIYGTYRLRQSKESMTEGPILAVIQNDVPTKVGGSLGAGSDPNILLQDLLTFSSESLHEAQRPELVVWPESPGGFPPLNREWIEMSAADSSLEHQLGLQHLRQIEGWIDQHQVPILLGSLTRHGDESRNSALRFDPKLGQREITQDKIHLFPIGEHLPWEGSFFHPWLEKAVGQGREDWLTAGSKRHVFSHKGNGREPWSYLIPICNEIMYPADAGSFHPADERSVKAIDFIINIASNAGFLRNRALTHTNMVLPFRAVEARVGIARSANTGVSCFVKPTGEVYGEIKNAQAQAWTGKGAPELELIAKAIQIRVEQADEFAKNPKLRAEFMKLVDEIKRLRAEVGVSGKSVQAVFVDTRRTLYSRTGDLFGWILLVALIIGILGHLWPHFPNRDRAPSNPLTSP